MAVKRRPEFGLEGRVLLDKINYETGTIIIKGKEYNLKDKEFPTIDPKDPFKLTKSEEQVMEKLADNFTKSYKLKRHMEFLFDKGSLYLIYNDNVLYHGCVPTHADGTFKEFEIEKGLKLKGRALLDKFDELARKAYYQNDGRVNDWLWYLWCGSCSPLFGKDQMTTFERYFIADKSTHKEHQDAYFKLRDDVAFCSKVLEEFGLDSNTAHIINGHIPVKVKEGESPIMAEGKLLVIDGGFSKAYQGVTGIAGYTLIYNSYGLRLSAHGAFESVEKAITEEQDILFSTFVLDRVTRKTVSDTGVGGDVKEQISELELLLEAYKDGQLIKKWSVK
ncbi:MAG: fructose-bisphosphatase class III [Fusobacteria bacterium]|nr:fructose-bisphosphatase class III [Fusobacteriota bacterium]